MISLAPFYYNQIILKEKWIKEISFSKRFCIDGVHRYFFCVYLQEDECGKIPVFHLYKNAHGFAALHLKHLAFYKAISEALERWAFLVNKNAIDVATTCGFAAYSSFFKRPARKISELEAIERWSVSSWWHCKLGHRLLPKINNIDAVEIITPFNCVSVVVLFSEPFLSLSQKESRAYGFASGATTRDAYNKALVELDTNYHVLKNRKDNYFNASMHRYEKRILFFSSKDGQKIFFQRLKKSVKRGYPVPKKIFDREVLGPWSKYATVWQTVYQDGNWDDEGLDNFLF